MILISAAPCVVRLCLTRLCICLKPACVCERVSVCIVKQRRVSRHTRRMCRMCLNSYGLSILPFCSGSPSVSLCNRRQTVWPLTATTRNYVRGMHDAVWKQSRVWTPRRQVAGLYIIHTSYQIINREQGAEMANIKSSQIEPLKYRLFAISLEPFEPERSSTTHFECLI